MKQPHVRQGRSRYTKQPHVSVTTHDKSRYVSLSVLTDERTVDDSAARYHVTEYGAGYAVIVQIRCSS